MAGFPEEDELRVADMLLARNVRKPDTPWHYFSILSYTNFARGAAHPRREAATGLEPFTPTHHLTYTLVFWAWFIMALGYSVSGLHKLGCASWRDGSALRRVLENPLARDTALRSALLASPPWVLQCATWGALALEVLFAPACLFRPTRRVAAWLMVAMHAGITCTVDFADLTLGVLQVHAFTYPSLFRDTAWDDALGHFRPWQFRLFTSCLGTYLAVHFAQLLPYAPALFSTAGMLPDSALLPTAAFPSLLSSSSGLLRGAAGSQALVAVLLALSCALASQRPAIRAPVCLALYAGWAMLANRNPFIANPGLPYVGWLLLACALWQEEEDPAAVPPAARRQWSATQTLRCAAANALGLLGCLQAVGFYGAWPALRGLAALSLASPLPLAFSHFAGHETFSNTFAYAAVTASGRHLAGAIGPQLYGRLKGAYNYKNTFGAALSYGPFFTEPWALAARDAVLQHGFCEPGHVVASSGFAGGEALRGVNITVAEHPDRGTQQWVLQVVCTGR